MNTRRNFIRGAVAALAACAMPWAVRQRMYGRITVGKNCPPCGKIKCFVNGLDVTNRAFDGNDREGWVLCYKRNADGQFMRDRDRVATEKLTGDVRFEITA